MRALGDKEIRASFVNCSKGEARRLTLPAGFAETPWSDLDFLGWRDPKAPDRGYVVAERGEDLVGIALRASTGARRSMLKSSICSVCVTPQAGSGIALLVAPRAGEAGRGQRVGSRRAATRHDRALLRERHELWRSWVEDRGSFVVVRTPIEFQLWAIRSRICGACGSFASPHNSTSNGSPSRSRATTRSPSGRATRRPRGAGYDRRSLSTSTAR